MYGRPSGVSITCPDQRCVTSMSGHERVAARLLEPLVACGRVVGLAGLVILAAEDHQIVVAVRLEPQVVVRIGCIPEQRVGDDALGDAAGHHVARVERELGLKQGGAGEAAVSDQRVVRRQDDVARTTSLRPLALIVQRVVGELFRVGVLVDLPAVRDDRAGQTGEVIARMEPRLILRSGRPDRRTSGTSFTNAASNPSSRGQCRFLAKRVRVGLAPCLGGRVQVAGTQSKSQSMSSSRTIASICAIAAQPASHAAWA